MSGLNLNTFIADTLSATDALMADELANTEAMIKALRALDLAEERLRVLAETVETAVNERVAEAEVEDAMAGKAEKEGTYLKGLAKSSDGYKALMAKLRAEAVAPYRDEFKDLENDVRASKLQIAELERQAKGIHYRLRTHNARMELVAHSITSAPSA